jgi:hypothetical protein
MGGVLMKLVLALIFTTACWAQEVKPTLTPSDSSRAAYWRAVSMKQSADAATKEANTALEKAVAALCPATHQPIAGQDGEPTCQLKPDPKKK